MLGVAVCILVSIVLCAPILQKYCLFIRYYENKTQSVKYISCEIVLQLLKRLWLSLASQTRLRSHIFMSIEKKTKKQNETYGWRIVPFLGRGRVWAWAHTLEPARPVSGAMGSVTCRRLCIVIAAAVDS